jgi:hypothetical protein
LHHVKGPTSFDFLKTVSGFVCETYRQACQKLGLLEDDQHWQDTMNEASTTDSATKLRNLFAIILSTCLLSSPLQLWNQIKEHLAADILYQQQQQHPELQL